MASSVDGLVSGLSTSQLISQLMQAESAGQNRLRSRVSDRQVQITALQGINTKVAALKTAAATMADPNTWKAVSATSSSDAATVSAGAGATAGQFTFSVTRLAAAQVRTAVVASSGTIVDGTPMSITQNGITTPITVTDTSAEGVASAINSTAVGVKAAVISTEQGKVLQLSATSTGAASAFTIAGLQASTTVLAPAADAQLTVGNPNTSGYTVTSATNTFSNVLPNVSVTVSALGGDIMARIKPNAKDIADKMQALLDAFNGLSSSINTNAAITTNGTTGATSGGPLAGDFTVRKVRDSLLSAISQGLDGYGSFKKLGVELDRTGKLNFDRNAFLAAYEADPTGTQNAVTTGLAAKLTGVATEANTNVTSAIQNGNDAVRSLNTQVADWDVRLKLRQDNLQRQFANLEVALGKMKDQSSWLAGQIAKLG